MAVSLRYGMNSYFPEYLIFGFLTKHDNDKQQQIKYTSPTE